MIILNNIELNNNSRPGPLDTLGNQNTNTVQNTLNGNELFTNELLTGLNGVNNLGSLKIYFQMN